jgi:hypothetical protein
MKLVTLPGGRSSVVSLQCSGCGGGIDGRDPAVADIDRQPRVAYYHVLCMRMPPRPAAPAPGLERAPLDLAGRRAAPRRRRHRLAGLA